MARKVKGVYNKQTPLLSDAIEAVKSRGMSIRKAAEHYGVKKSTLADHVSGKVLGKKSGRDTIFTADIEKEIVAKAHLASQKGFGVSRKQLLNKAGQLAKSLKLKTPFKNGTPGQAWWDGFKTRNPDLVLRKPEKLSSTRARNLNKPIVDGYFKDLEHALDELDLKDSPVKIWNMDETNMSMEHTPLKKCAKKGAKSVPGLVSNSRETVTVVACINAAGGHIPPMIIVKGKTEKSLNAYNKAEGPVNAVWHYQKNAWIDEDGCIKWFNEVFLQNCGPARPQLLILDRHNSHESITLLEIAVRENITILGLPAHTTHFLCPLDRTVFGPLKKHYNAICDDFTTQSPSNLVMKWNWSNLCKQAILQAFTARNITSGFRSCGIFPFNPSAIPEEAFLPAQPTNRPNDAPSTSHTVAQPSNDSNVASSSGVVEVHSQVTEMPAYDGDNPDINVNLELLSQIALLEAENSEPTANEKEEVQDILSIALLLGESQSNEPTLVELPLTLPPPDNAGDNGLSEINAVRPKSNSVDDPLWSSTMIVSPPKTPLQPVDWNTEISNLFTIPSCEKELPKKKPRKTTGHKILTSPASIKEKKSTRENKENMALKKQVNAENRRKKALDQFLKKMK